MAGGSIGWVYVSGGTYGAFSTTTTAEVASTATVIPVASTSGLIPGQYVSIVGVSNTRTISAISASTITVNYAVGVTVASGTSVAFTAPVWKEFGTISA